MAVVSKHKPRQLGTKDDGSEEIISEEQRPHIHVIGSTQEGKSKYFEHLMRGDVLRGRGLLLLDPATGAKTVYDMLRWCCWQNKHKNRNIKVCLIDPYHRYPESGYGVVPAITPFIYDKKGAPSAYLRDKTIHDLQDAVNVFTSNSDPANTMNVARYLPAIFTALYDAKSPLSDARYFTDDSYHTKRDEIIKKTDDDTRAVLRDAYTGSINVFRPTISRLNYFHTGTLGLMFTPKVGFDFFRAVADNWVILVNLDTGGGINTLPARLLGTIIMNSVISAVERFNLMMKNKSGKDFAKRFYIYVDEASMFANRKVAETLSLKQKTGIRMTLAHQYNKQFEDEYVLNAIYANSKITVQFNTPSYHDRKMIAQQFYGGDISPEYAQFVNADLPKQTAIIKVDKSDPVRVKAPTIKEPNVSASELKEFIESIYTQPFYHEAEDLEAQLNPKREADERPRATVPPRDNQANSPSRAENDSPPVSEDSVPEPSPADVSAWEDISAKLSSVQQSSAKNAGRGRGKGKKV